MKVYLCDCTETAGDPSRFLDALPPERRAYAGRFKNPVGKAAAAVGFLLVAKALREEIPGFTATDWTIGEHGKPFLPDSSPHFSLSHSDGLCAAVVHDAPIGLDVERVRPLRSALLPRFCTPEEIERCRLDPNLAVALWTKREARAKENGHGIGQNLVSLPTEGVTTLTVESNGRIFALSYTSPDPPELLFFSPEELLAP